MATVYLAQDLKHDRKVALKVLKPELAAVIGAERFVVEIKTTAALQHPHILPLFDSGTADGFLYYVMPFIDGETLRSKLDRETQLGIDEAVKHRGRHRRRPRLRAPARRHPPRHQAREHPAPRRPADGGRLRHRAGAERRRRRPDDRDRHVARHPALHESRAGHGREGDHRPQRRLLAGQRALRDADRQPAAHRRLGPADHHEDRDRHRAPGDRAAEVGARQRGGRGGQVHREAAGGPVRERQGLCRGAGQSGVPRDDRVRRGGGSAAPEPHGRAGRVGVGRTPAPGARRDVAPTAPSDRGTDATLYREFPRGRRVHQLRGTGNRHLSGRQPVRLPRGAVARQGGVHPPGAGPAHRPDPARDDQRLLPGLLSGRTPHRLPRPALRLPEGDFPRRRRRPPPCWIPSPASSTAGLAWGRDGYHLLARDAGDARHPLPHPGDRRGGGAGHRSGQHRRDARAYHARGAAGRARHRLHGVARSDARQRQLDHRLGPEEPPQHPVGAGTPGLVPRGGIPARAPAQRHRRGGAVRRRRTGGHRPRRRRCWRGSRSAPTAPPTSPSRRTER